MSQNLIKPDHGQSTEKCNLKPEECTVSMETGDCSIREMTQAYLSKITLCGPKQYKHCGGGAELNLFYHLTLFIADMRTYQHRCNYWAGDIFLILFCITLMPMCCPQAVTVVLDY